MDMMTYLILARKEKSEIENESNITQRELTEIEPEGIAKEDEVMTIEAELITNQSELMTIQSDSTTPKALARIEPESPTTYKTLVMKTKNSTKMKQELIKMNQQSTIMTSEQLQKEAGVVTSKDKFPKKKVYARIVEALDSYEYESQNVEDPQPVEIIFSLMVVVDLINKWMKKNIDKYEEKKDRKNALEKLQIQIGNELQKLVAIEGVATELGSDLAAVLIQGIAYTFSPTPLLTYIVGRLISMYKIEELNGDVLKIELRNFLLADNDVIGSTSLATQDVGASGGLSVGFDVGKFILPCLKLKVGIDGKAQVANTSMIITECQSELNNSDGLHRYSLMKMKGRTIEGKLIGKLTVGIATPNPAGSDEEILEQTTLNTFPKLEASAEVAGDVACVFIQTSDSNPRHFNEVAEIDHYLFDIVQDKSQVDRLQLPSQTYTSLVSNAYGAEASIGAEGSLGGSVKTGDPEEQSYKSTIMGATGQVRGGIYANIKFTTYTYQSKLSENTFKTQRTKMYLKQVYMEGKASGSAQGAGVVLYDEKKKKKYNLVNSLSYESGFIFWDQETQELSQKGVSGLAVGHALIAKELIKNVYGSDTTKRSNYIKALAKQLHFAEKDESILTNFFDKYNQDGLLEDILDGQKGSVFLEATYLTPTDINFSLDPEFDGNTPQAECFEQLGSENKTLQSLRFRTALEDDLNLSKNRFKLGFSTGIVSVKIELGTIKEAGTLKLSDLVIEWYDNQGRPTDTQPSKYVPSSFLIL